MKGNEIASSLPAKAGAAREAAILDHVRKGNFFLKWVPMRVQLGNSTATFSVTAEPLMLGESWDDGFYPGVSAETMQKIADSLGATLLTPKLVDEIWKNASIRIDPIVGMAATDAEVKVMADTATFLKHTSRIKDRIRAKRSQAGSSPVLVSNIGKYWTVGSGTSLGKRNKYGSIAAQNYGFFFTKPGTRNRTVTGIPDVDLYQTPGYAHDMAHSDYSQVVMLVKRNVELCSPSAVAGLGASSMNCRMVDIYDLASDPEFAAVLSHEGTINMRMPSVAFNPSASSGSSPPPPAPVGKGSSSGPPPSYSSPPSGAVPRRTRRGEKGADVVAWQLFLMSKGYDLSPYGADGDHGDKTESASLDWESKHPSGGSGAGGGTSIWSSASMDSGSSMQAIGLVAAGLGLGYLGYSLLTRE